MFPWDRKKLGIPWFMQPTADFITEDIPAAAGRVGEFFVDDIPQAWGEFWQTEEARKARLTEEQAVARQAAQDQAKLDFATSQSQRRMPVTTSQHISDYVASEKERKKGDKKEMDEWEQAFLMSLMENMRGEDIGQAPAVVAGGGQRQWPSMMGQFSPWEQQKPYWWIA